MPDVSPSPTWNYIYISIIVIYWNPLKQARHHRCGVMCVGRSRDEAEELFQRVKERS